MNKRISKILASLLVTAFLFSMVPVNFAEAATYYYYRTYTTNSYFKWIFNFVPIQTTIQQPTKPTTQQPTTQQPTAQQPTTQQPQASTQLSQFEAQVVQLVNQERAKVGLKPLAANVSLSKVARTKSADMRDKNYFAHNSPTYGSPFDMMKSFGITYRTAGENIAAGQRTPEQVVTAWMNSPGHRANILNASFTEIGVGYVSGGSYGHYWTQMFIGK